MKNRSVAIVVASFLLLLLVLLPESTHARPSGALRRHKRVSDQRLAELETLMALKKLKGQLLTVPVGFGRVDPAKIGRRRRSNTGSDLQKLKRFLESISMDLKSFGDESKNIFPVTWRNVDDRFGDETENTFLF